MRFSVTTPVLLAASLAITSGVTAAPTGSPNPAAANGMSLESGSPRHEGRSPNPASGTASPFGFPGMFMARRSPALRAAGSRRAFPRRRSYKKREDAEPVEDVASTVSQVVDSGLGLGLGLGLPVPGTVASHAQGAPSTASSTATPVASIPLGILQNVLPASSIPLGVVHTTVIPATGVPLGIVDSKSDTPSVLFESVSETGSPIFSAVPLNVVQDMKATAQDASSNVLESVLDKVIPAANIPIGVLKSTVIPAAGVPLGVIKSKTGATDVLFATASDKGETVFNTVPLAIVQSQAGVVGPTAHAASSTILGTVLGKAIPAAQVPLGIVHTTVIPATGIPLGVINSKKDTPEVLFQTIGGKGETVYNAVPLSIVQAQAGTATGALSATPLGSVVGIASGAASNAPVDPTQLPSTITSKLSHVVRDHHEWNYPSAPPNSPASPADRQHGRYAPWAFAPYDHTPIAGAFIDLEVRSPPPTDLPNPWPVMNGVVDVDETDSPVSCDEDGFPIHPPVPAAVPAAVPAQVGMAVKGTADRAPINAAGLTDALPSPPSPPSPVVPNVAAFPGSPAPPIAPPNTPVSLPISGSAAAFDGAVAKAPVPVPVQPGQVVADVMPGTS